VRVNLITSGVVGRSVRELEKQCRSLRANLKGSNRPEIFFRRRVIRGLGRPVREHCGDKGLGQ